MSTFIDTHRHLVDAIERALEQGVKLEALIRALANVEPCAVTGRITASQLAIALGEQDVWPRSIMSQCEAAQVLPFRRSRENPKRGCPKKCQPA